MGQGSSSSRGSEGISRRRNRLSQMVNQRDGLRTSPEYGQEEGEQSLLTPGTSATATPGLQRLEGQRAVAAMATFRRQISAQSMPAEPALHHPAEPERAGVLLEQAERPLMSMADLGLGDAPITHINASPIPRRPSVISRLGSRLSQRYSSVEPVMTQDDRDAMTLRESLARAADPEAEVERTVHRHRFSMFESLTHGFSSSSSASSSHQRRLAPISRPIPIPANHDYDALDSTRRAPTPNPPNTGSQRSVPLASSSNRSSRLTRVRRSISGPLENFFSGGLHHHNHHHHNHPMDEEQHSATQRSARQESNHVPNPDETEYLLPPINVADSTLDLEENGSTVAAAGDLHSRTVSPAPALPERPTSWAQRWADRSPTARRERGRAPNLLRGRSSRLIRRDDETPLSRILQLAAAAIAAQLSGNDDTVENMEAMANEQFDGGLNGFVEELNTVAGGSTTVTQEGQASMTALPPLNFWRVFRFVGPHPDHPTRQPNAESGGTEPRTVTLVVVGVRSVPSSSIHRDTPDAESSLDALLNSPSTQGPSRAGGAGSLLRSLNGRSRFTPNRRRSSMPGPNPFPAQYDSQRHHRVNESSRAAGDSPEPEGSAPGVSLESPPGPHPPPSTPADMSHLSTRNSAQNTPSRQPSSASTNRMAYEEHNESTNDQGVRQRRRSDSEYARHRELGSGAARRNGTIDPDGGPVQGRSWLIYVVGTNLPADHPAFTTPTLFTDNPSYEDLMLLSTILGPVKPPVATSDDVAAAGNMFKVGAAENDGTFRAVAVDGDEHITVAPNDSCLICLEEYTTDQVVRKLNKCVHMFHQECVDQWLTTGRNSCPLCRGQGVDEKARETSDPGNPPPEAHGLRRTTSDITSAAAASA